ncbi:histidine--tRNA ligase [Candidatus Nomurabacteria bacterium]|nr:histidine--tRNA ligase [Candidatus Nomurabacteria bacterium]USN95087.1 MAG: histidine--tRNA ligase [Candidatus Nomurabacteria bacterium]
MSPKQKTVKEAKSPKGMRDLIGDEYYKFQGFFEKAQEVAIYYGFSPIETPILENEEIFTTTIGEGTDIIDKEMYTLKTKGGTKLAMRPEKTAGVVRSYIENGMGAKPQPVMVYQYGPSFRHDNPQAGRWRQFYQFDLDAIGSDKSIIDALIIKTVYTIIKEAGGEDINIDINSIGDKECRNQYVKELTSYYRKHVNALPAVDRERLKTNPLRILDSKDPKTMEINQNAPDAVSHLCSACKKHFKEVLEYLEELGIPYRINKNLVRGLSYYTRTVFEVTVSEENEQGEVTEISIAGGGRYDYLAKNLGSKKDVPAVGAAIGVDRVIAQPWSKDLSPRNVKKPKVSFIQIGNDAKLKALVVIEMLRQAKVPVYQSISKDSLSTQLGITEKMGIPYALILGQKEALDGTVIVRNMENRSQEIVKLDDLPSHIKALK